MKLRAMSQQNVLKLTAVKMIKFLTLAILGIFSLQVSATTIKVSGLEKLPQTEFVDIGYDFHFNDCLHYWDCQGVGALDSQVPVNDLDDRIAYLNNKYGGNQYVSTFQGRDSVLILKFSGYPNTCRAILSYKNAVNVTLQEDGSCFSN